jgi:hypothetical protein
LAIWIAALEALFGVVQDDCAACYRSLNLVTGRGHFSNNATTMLLHNLVCNRSWCIVLLLQLCDIRIIRSSDTLGFLGSIRTRSVTMASFNFSSAVSSKVRGHSGDLPHPYRHPCRPDSSDASTFVLQRVG